MADAVTTQVLINNDHRLVLKLTNLSDGTGEAAVVKVDVSAYTASKVAIQKVQYCIVGMIVSLFWVANANVKIMDLQNDGEHCFEDFGGLWNNAGEGVTGDVALTTTAHHAGDTYWIILDMVKKKA